MSLVQVGKSATADSSGSHSSDPDSELANEIRAQLAEIDRAKLERDPTGPSWVLRELEKLMPLMDRAVSIIETLERARK